MSLNGFRLTSRTRGLLHGPRPFLNFILLDVSSTFFSTCQPLFAFKLAPPTFIPHPQLITSENLALQLKRKSQAVRNLSTPVHRSLVQK